VSKILHVYTLPEFWETSADLPYAFVYVEFINADIFSLFSCTLSSKSFCKIRVHSLLSNNRQCAWGGTLRQTVPTPGIRLCVHQTATTDSCWHSDGKQRGGDGQWTKWKMHLPSHSVLENLYAVTAAPLRKKKKHFHQLVLFEEFLLC